MAAFLGGSNLSLNLIPTSRMLTSREGSVTSLAAVADSASQVSRTLNLMSQVYTHTMFTLMSGFIERGNVEIIV